MTTPHYLFLCDHSAGKSVLAATYFRAAAARLGLDVTVAVAGPDPDCHVMDSVAGLLAAQGFIVAHEPRQLDESILTDADHVVSVGCDPAGIPEGRVDLTEWDVPMLSADFLGSAQAIHAASEELADSLAVQT